MIEQCRVSEDERHQDVECVEPTRQRAMYTGLEIDNKDHQELLLNYADDYLTVYQFLRVRNSLARYCVAKKSEIERGDLNRIIRVIREAMHNIERSYIVDFLEKELSGHCEDWLYENYGVYEPWEV